MSTKCIRSAEHSKLFCIVLSFDCLIMTLWQLGELGLDRPLESNGHHLLRWSSLSTIQGTRLICLIFMSVYIDCSKSVISIICQVMVGLDVSVCICKFDCLFNSRRKQLNVFFWAIFLIFPFP